jgi:serine phosphatase RsbU (regulator of sigma subunit)
MSVTGGTTGSGVAGWLLAVAQRLSPELETLQGRERAFGVFDVVGSLCAAPLVLAGLVWLAAVTDLTLMRTSWPVLSLLFLLLFVFGRLDFFLFVEIISTMFPDSQIEVRLFPDQTVLRHPDNRPPVSAAAWAWLRTAPEARCFLPGTTLPWGEETGSDGVLVAPVPGTERPEPVGGIYLAHQRHPKAVASLLPAVQSLAAQIGSALHRAETYAQTLAHQRVEQELALAGQIQASFLPKDLPHVPGWELAATLEPARETCGDFYDVIPLPHGQFGILVADVADKGLGAALFMALSCTLLRTYALQYHARPDYVLRVTNRRILMDTDTDMFVTVFYGVLDAATGTLTYCNAGHHPPYLLGGQNDGALRALSRTGMALGVLENMAWEQETVRLAPGDALVLYTDGITDAEDENGTFFGQERLLEAVQASRGRPAQDVQDALIAQVHAFASLAPQFDDITLMVVTRAATTDLLDTDLHGLHGFFILSVCIRENPCTNDLRG